MAAAFRSSGKTQAEYCVEQGIPLNHLRYHLYKKHKKPGRRVVYKQLTTGNLCCGLEGPWAKATCRKNTRHVIKPQPVGRKF